MQSKIWIDIDHDNQPVLRIDYRESDDVKDKLVRRFIDAFDKESWFATCFFDKKSTDPTVKTIGIVRPIPPQHLGIHVLDMQKLWEKEFNKQQEVEALKAK